MYQEKSKTSSDSGITLIALIVTIIIMLILAGVSISMVTGENGVIKNAKKSVKQTEIAQVDEKAKLIATDLLISKRSDGDSDDITIADIVSGLQKEGYTIETETSGTQTVTADNIKFKIDGTETSNVQVAPGKTKTVDVVVDLGDDSGTKYYVVIRGSSYELKMEDNSPTVSREETKRESNSSGSNDIDSATSNATSVATTDASTSQVKITGVADGNATVTVTLKNGVSKTFPVTVTTSVSISEAISDGTIQVGDTVTYTPAGSNVVVGGAYSGTGSDQTLTANNTATAFKVWKIDKENNKIQLVIASNPSITLTLQSAAGYNNSVQILNNVCSQLYSNSEKGITARSFDAKDIEDAMVEKGKTVEDVAKNATSSTSSYPLQYGQKNDGGTDPRDSTKTNLSKYTSNTYVPSIYGTYTSSDDADITSKQDDLRLAVKTDGSDFITGTASAKAKSLTVKQTYYYLSQSDLATNIGDTRGNILGSRTCWLASRCVNAGSDGAYFYVRYLSSGYFNYWILYSSSSYINYNTLALCPSVYLGTSVQLKSTGTNTWTVQ